MSVTAVAALATTRAAIGASAWVSPVGACRLFGMDVSRDRSAGLFLRMAGTRDVALAVGPLAAGRSRRRELLTVGAACDVADLAAVAIARKQGTISTTAAVLLGAGSLACLALGAKALSDAADA